MIDAITVWDKYVLWICMLYLGFLFLTPFFFLLSKFVVKLKPAFCFYYEKFLFILASIAGWALLMSFSIRLFYFIG